MLRILILIFLGLILLKPAIAQKGGYNVKVTSEPQSVLIPEREKQKSEIEVQTDSLQKDLDVYVETMQSEKFISDNVVVSMDVEVLEEDVQALKVTYSYALKSDTIKYKTDDFRLGSYTLDASNAMKVTLEIMKRSIENQLSRYVNATKHISFEIYGNADATAIDGSIPYKGEYGKRLTEMCTMAKGEEQMLITTDQGILTNEELAFVRSFTVRNFIENKIPALEQARKEYTHHANVSEYKGGMHRRVTIEMILHNAIEERQ